MPDHSLHIQDLETQISALESQLNALRTELAQVRKDASPEHDMPDASSTSSNLSAVDETLALAIDGGFPDDWRNDILSALSQSPEEASNKWPLTREEYKRYGRQLIMPEIGLQGQLKLKASRILIVGVGGLGCPAAAYLAGAGVGTLGIVDGDVVEESNLHRQILHSVKSVGMGKVDSVKAYIEALNPLVKLEPHKKRLSSDNSLEIFASYDVVLDCTDTPASRYLISDTCVLLGKPLVSASALRTEGQLIVFNHPARPQGDPAGGPCYRCIFPKPSSPDSVVSCGDGGILGPVVGVMGVLQALEAIKLITASSTNTPSNEIANAAASAFADLALDPPSLLLFSAYSAPQFRSIQLRRRSPKCAACSAQATVTAEALTSGSMDYIQFCGIANPINLLSEEERVTATEYASARKEISLNGRQHRIIDVREKVQFDLCHLLGSTNIPFSVLSSLQSSQNTEEDRDTRKILERLGASIAGANEDPVYVVCRLGNDSQIAVRKLKELGLDGDGKTWIGDIKEGLKAWRENVDPSFPDY